MSRELDKIVEDLEACGQEMGEHGHYLDEHTRSWYATISAEHLGLARRLRKAIEVERTELHEDEAMMLLTVYAAEDDAKLTESARALKHKLLSIADKGKKSKQNHERFKTRAEALAAYQKEHKVVMVDREVFEDWLYQDVDKDTQDNTANVSEDIFSKVINAIDTVRKKHIDGEAGLTVADEQTINLVTEIVHTLEDQQKGVAK